MEKERNEKKDKLNEEQKLFYTKNPKEIIKKLIAKRKEFIEKILNDPDLQFQECM